MRPKDAQGDAVSQEMEEKVENHIVSPELDELLQVIGRLLGDIFLENENENQ